MTDQKTFTDEDLRERLTEEQYYVTQHAGTERAFSGIYADTKTPGTYKCVVCETPLFSSETKYDSRSGWPSFWAPITPEVVKYNEDISHGMKRVEAVCATCNAHLGHIFPDGPQPSGDRFCMNSASLVLEPSEDDKADG